MNKVFKVLFLLIGAFSISTACLGQSKYQVTGQKVNVRSAPSTTGSKVVGSLNSGAVVTVESISNGWATISYNGKTCYVKSDFLKKVSDAKSTEKKKQTSSAKETPRSSSSERQTSKKSQQRQSAPGSFSYADDKGFDMNADFRVGYKDKTVSTELDFDMGYQFNRVFYLGAGPMISASFGDGGSSVVGGGYGKMRIVIPIDGNVKPMGNLRGGYSYDFNVKDGNPFIGFDLGVNINRRFHAGIGVVGTWAKMTEVKTSGRKVTTEEKTEMKFVPQLFFGYDFSKGGSNAPRRQISAEEQARRKAKSDARKARIRKFFHEAYWEDDLGYGFGLYSKNDLHQGSYWGDNLTWNKMIGKHWSLGPGLGWRKYTNKQDNSVGPDGKATTTFMPIFLRTGYTMNEVAAKLKPFVYLDLGYRMKLTDELEDDGQGVSAEQSGLHFEPRVGMLYNDHFSLSVGYSTIKNNFAVYNADTDHSPSTIEVRLGARF